MKSNQKPLEFVFASIVIIGTILFTMNAIRTRSYSGDNLNFDIGGGTVKVTNPSNQPVLVQLIGTGTRTFSVSSTAEDISGTSTTQGTGNSSRQLFEFELLPGVTEFTVIRRTTTTPDMNLVAIPPTQLDVTVQLLSVNQVRMTLIAAIVITLAALFYIVSVINHRWITVFRGKTVSIDDTRPSFVITDGGQSKAAREYRENRG